MARIQERDIAGQRFGELTAIRRTSRPGIPHIKWLFRCSCGVESEMFKSNVTRGEIKSCLACGHQRQAREVTRHDASHTPEYQIYHSAKDRCCNPNNPRYAQYGGRGIRFEFHDFAHFLASLGLRPDPKLSLNRIDNDGPYSPENCEWATWEAQFKTRRPWNWRQKTA